MKRMSLIILAMLLVPIVAETSLAASKKKDTRPRISVDYVHADVRFVLKQLASKMGLNIVMDQTVKGTVTLSLKNVPASGIFNLVVKLNDLQYKSLGNTLVVGSQETLDRIPDSVLR